jgi:hypothetical protein
VPTRRSLTQLPVQPPTAFRPSRIRARQPTASFSRCPVPTHFVSQRFYNDLDINAFVEAKRESFEAVALLPRGRNSASSVALWSANIGWRDASWSSAATLIAERTNRWIELLTDFVGSCRKVQQVKFKAAQAKARLDGVGLTVGLTRDHYRRTRSPRSTTTARGCVAGVECNVWVDSSASGAKSPRKTLRR